MVETQPDFFGPYGGVAPYVETDTSRDASDAITADIGTLRAKVLRCIKDASHGRTDDEMEALLQMRHQTLSARRRELVLLNQIKDSEERRKTRSGRNAIVWVIS